MIRFNKPTIEKKDLETVLYCMVKDDLTPGEYLREFQGLLSKELGLACTIAFNSYLHSFETIFRMIGASTGDEVILPAFARYRTLHAVLKLGLKPVLVDIEEDSLLPSFSEIKKVLGKKTCCIIIPQLFGIPHNLLAYRDFELPIIEDLDGSIGSKVNGKPAGSFGNFVTMHFSDDAVITTGSGGMVASRDIKLKTILNSLLQDGSSIDYLMSDLNASLGVSQLKKLESSMEKRRRIGEYFDRAVMASSCSFLGRNEDQELSYSSYVVKSETPWEDITRFFKRYGIPVKRGIEKPLHHVLGLDVHDFLTCEELYPRIIALPIYPTLNMESIESITKGIRAVL
ncbi:MAG: DegT/DnrJ/EryC1/StrS family aminotransferase [Spirochaetota bacterium]